MSLPANPSGLGWNFQSWPHWQLCTWIFLWGLQYWARKSSELFLHQWQWLDSLLSYLFEVPIWNLGSMDGKGIYIPSGKLCTLYLLFCKQCFICKHSLHKTETTLLYLWIVVVQSTWVFLIKTYSEDQTPCNEQENIPCHCCMCLSIAFSHSLVKRYW